MLNSAVRRVLGDANQSQIVRDERVALTAKIREQVNREAERFGVAIVDARIRRVDLPRQISEKVFDRMRTERAREAAEYRALGQQDAQQIRSSAQRDATVIVAEAQQKGDTMRGEGEAERNRVFAEAFGPDPDFFAFYRSMQAYDASLKDKGARFVVSPSSDFFRYFDSASGKARPSRDAPIKEFEDDVHLTKTPAARRLSWRASLSSGALAFAVSPAFARRAPESFADLAAAVTPAVVNISATQVDEEKDADARKPPPGSSPDDMFEEFMKRHRQPWRAGCAAARVRSARAS